MSLWLDRSWLFNPTTIIGSLYTELFQVVYVAYYAIVYAVLGVHLVLLIKAYRSGIPSRLQVELDRTRMVLVGWMWTILAILLLNTAYPALSPRIYLSEE